MPCDLWYNAALDDDGNADAQNAERYMIPFAYALLWSHLEEAPFLLPFLVPALFTCVRPRLERGCGRATGGCRLYSCESMLRPLVARVGGFDVPLVGLKRIASAADTHLCEVADGVLGFW